MRSEDEKERRMGMEEAIELLIRQFRIDKVAGSKYS
jgi:hypothetical protein